MADNNPFKRLTKEVQRGNIEGGSSSPRRLSQEHLVPSSEARRAHEQKGLEIDRELQERKMVQGQDKIMYLLGKTAEMSLGDMTGDSSHSKQKDLFRTPTEAGSIRTNPFDTASVISSSAGNDGPTATTHPSEGAVSETSLSPLLQARQGKRVEAVGPGTSTFQTGIEADPLETASELNSSIGDEGHEEYGENLIPKDKKEIRERYKMVKAEIEGKRFFDMLETAPLTVSYEKILAYDQLRDQQETKLRKDPEGYVKELENFRDEMVKQNPSSGIEERTESSKNLFEGIPPVHVVWMIKAKLKKLPEEGLGVPGESRKDLEGSFSRISLENAKNLTKMAGSDIYTLATLGLSKDARKKSVNMAKRSNARMYWVNELNKRLDSYLGKTQE